MFVRSHLIAVPIVIFFFSRYLSWRAFIFKFIMNTNTNLDLW